MALLAFEKFRFKRTIFLKTADAEHAETDNAAFLVHAPHHRVASSRPHITRRVGKGHLEVIMFPVKPSFTLSSIIFLRLSTCQLIRSPLRRPLPLQFMMKEPLKTPLSSITLHCGAARFGATSTITLIVLAVFDSLPMAAASSSATGSVVRFEATMSLNVSAEPPPQPVMVAALSRSSVPAVKESASTSTPAWKTR